ncbi:MAG TPA: amidohydrolase family protein [Gemmataceae bacterium]|nr:amidohydrolase family protein [Gemmataceae bacterium]
MWTLTARWIVPVDGSPQANGTVTLDGERIAAVEPHGVCRPDIDLGDAAILPGLVNTHTHLDLSGARGRTPPSTDFVGWLRQVIAYRRSRTPEEVREDIRAGLTECVRHGTTLVGDISGDGSSWDILKEAPLQAVVFRELLGLTEERAEAALTAARGWLAAHPDTEMCRAGLSPHAPYSIRSSLFAQAALLARSPKHPLAVHLAESREELELLHQRRGPFVAFLREFGGWDPNGLSDSPAAVMKICDQRIPKLFVHGNYLAPNTRIPRGGTIVYCPRTHAAFGHPPHPFREFLARGKRVALGTDSLASNPDLDILAEARFLHRHYPDISGAALLRMATLAGAEALGWDKETGSLAPGNSADLVVIALPAAAGDPHELILNSTEPVRAVLCRGRWVHGAAEIGTVS